MRNQVNFMIYKLTGTPFISKLKINGFSFQGWLYFCESLLDFGLGASILVNFLVEIQKAVN